jgi:hypothetical protein
MLTKTATGEISAAASQIKTTAFWVGVFAIAVTAINRAILQDGFPAGTIIANI